MCNVKELGLGLGTRLPPDASNKSFIFRVYLVELSLSDESNVRVLALFDNEEVCDQLIIAVSYPQHKYHHRAYSL